MTPEHARIQLRRAVRAAVAAGARHKRRLGLQNVQLTAADFAELLVMPAIEAAIEAAIEQTIEQTLQRACEPWEGALLNAAPLPGSPLWAVWVNGALCAIDHLADQLHLSPAQLDSDCVLVSCDAGDMVRAQVTTLLSRAAVPSLLQAVAGQAAAD